MSVLFLQYPPCTTCKKAKAWLDERGVAYEARRCCRRGMRRASCL